MRILRAFVSLLLFVGCVCCVHQASGVAQTSTAFHEVLRVDGSSLDSKDPASVQAFDISPDGSLLAVLFQSASSYDDWLRLLIKDVATGKTRMDIHLSAPGIRPDINSFPWYEPHVEFSPDQRFVIVQDWRMIRILEIAKSRVVKTFTSTNEQLSVPIAIHRASSNDLVLISYGTKVPFVWGNKGFNDLVTPQRVHNELVDVSSGQQRSSWESPDIPQSLSVDGRLAAVSEGEGSTPLVEIEIVDAKTGRKLKTLHSGYAFKKPWAPGPAGRVIGKFLSDDEILLSPDEHIDSTGHKSGQSLRIMRLSDGKLVREIRPPDFGPMGEITVSPGRDCFALLNWYISPRLAKRDAAPPGLPSLIVFPDPTKTLTYTVSHLQTGVGLETNQWLDSWRPRIANNAAAVAIVEDRGIVVFQRK